MVFEHFRQPLLSRKAFLLRMLRHFLIASGVVIVSLGIGILGYHKIAGLSWVDSFLNASMILTGMGPVDPMTTPASKIFASLYALFSGVAFLTMVAVLFAPVIHRFFHRFHLDLDDEEDETAEGKRKRKVKS